MGLAEWLSKHLANRPRFQKDAKLTERSIPGLQVVQEGTTMKHTINNKKEHMLVALALQGFQEVMGTCEKDGLVEGTLQGHIGLVGASKFEDVRITSPKRCNKNSKLCVGAVIRHRIDLKLYSLPKSQGMQQSQAGKQAKSRDRFHCEGSVSLYRIYVGLNCGVYVQATELPGAYGLGTTWSIWAGDPNPPHTQGLS